MTGAADERDASLDVARGIAIIAVVLAHVGRVLGRKAATPDSRRMKLFICFGIATALMLLAIPWPGMRAGRPLFRF